MFRQNTIKCRKPYWQMINDLYKRSLKKFYIFHEKITFRIFVICYTNGKWNYRTPGCTRLTEVNWVPFTASSISTPLHFYCLTAHLLKMDCQNGFCKGNTTFIRYWCSHLFYLASKTVNHIIFYACCHIKFPLCFFNSLSIIDAKDGTVN